MIYGVVLAAGLSSRMGEPKLLLPFEGACMVQHAVRAACATCDAQLVVASHTVRDAVQLPDGVHVTLNEHPEEGMASSVACAVRWLRQRCPACEGVLFFLGDEPGVDLSLASRVRHVLEEDPTRIVVGRIGGRMCHPTAFGSAWFDELASMRGDEGGRGVVRAHPEAVRFVEADGHAGAGADIDTPQDYCEAVLDTRRLVVVRGAGDIATGTIVRLHEAGFLVIALDIAKPTVIRRTVSFAQALFSGSTVVESLEGVRCETDYDMAKTLARGAVPVMVDPEASAAARLHPMALVDAILAKRNLGTTMSMAPVVVALGPGFTAGLDCHAVVETKRGHDLGRVIYDGAAYPDTGIPGTIAGYSSERVIHAPAAGRVTVLRDIGSLVRKGDVVATIEGTDVLAPLDGVVRGMICDGSTVPRGMKMADVDPRGEVSYCLSVSDKARAVAGGCLEAIMHLGGCLQSR